MLYVLGACLLELFVDTKSGFQASRFALQRLMPAHEAPPFGVSASTGGACIFGKRSSTRSIIDLLPKIPMPVEPLPLSHTITTNSAFKALCLTV